MISVYSSAVVGCLILISSCALASPRNPRVIPPENPNDAPRLPLNLTRSVLVIGGGPAGLSAAIELAERGYRVRVAEEGSKLGGPLAPVQLNAMKQLFNLSSVHQGYFTNFYQTLDILNRSGVKSLLHEETTASIYHHDTKKIQTIRTDHAEFIYHFKILWDAVYTYKCILLTDLITWEKTQTELDHYNHFCYQHCYSNMTFLDYKVHKKTPVNCYNCFMRPALIGSDHNPEMINAADALARMQVYFFTNESALRSHHVMVVNSSDAHFLDRWLQLLKKSGVKLSTNVRVNELDVDDLNGRVTGIFGETETYDYVVLATPLTATMRILTATYEGNTGAPPIYEPLQRIIPRLDVLTTVPQTMVAKLWLTATVSPLNPTIINTVDLPHIETIVILDHLMNPGTSTNGSIVEVGTNSIHPIDTVILLAELSEVLPELSHCSVTTAVWTQRSEATQLDTAYAANRLRSDAVIKAGIRNLILAGDWLDTSGYPSADIEKTVSIGREAANQILIQDAVRQVTLTVPFSEGPITDETEPCVC